MKELVRTEAIVISHIVYADNALIVQLFTREKGLLSVMIRGINSKSKSRQALLQPFSPLVIDLVVKEQNDIQSVKEINLAWNPIQTWTDLKRSTVAMFMAEVLAKTLHRGYVNSKLFDQLNDISLLLENEPKISGVPAVFLNVLCSEYGFSPEIPDEEELNWCFDASGAGFVLSNAPGVFGVEVAKLLLRLQQIPAKEFLSIAIPRNLRAPLIDALLKYLLNHLDEHRKISSHHILESVFSD